MNPIPYGRQSITNDDIQAVIDVLKSDYLTQGPNVGLFEEAFAKYVGSKYAVAVSNGTAALHLSCLALNVDSQTKVITTPISFAASSNCVRYCNGKVVFADIDKGSYLIDIESVKSILESEEKGTYQGIIPVDFTGRPINLEELKILADEYGLWIISDSCHSPGGAFIDSKGRVQTCGNGTYADLSIFSFHPVKHIAAGEGGMITTNNESLYHKLLTLRSHGITRNQESFQNSIEQAGGSESYPQWYMEMQSLGYNYRLTDFQSALGISQLKKANEGVARRREIAKNYYEALKAARFIKNQSGIVEGHAYHLYIIEVEDRHGLYQFLRQRNIYAQIHYIPTHFMPYYKELGWKNGDLPNAEAYYENCISLPMFPTLTNKEQNFIIQCINEYYCE